MADDAKIRKVRKKLEKAQAKGRDEDVIAILEELVMLEPTTPRWPHKLGDVNRKLGKKTNAVMAYAKAVDLYADQGFIARAIAMAKTVLNLDPKRIDILERVDPEAARALHRAARPAGASMAPPAFESHPAIIMDMGTLPEMALAGAATHPAVIQDGVPPPAHPAIIPDSDPDLSDAPPLPAAPTPQLSAEQEARHARAREIEQEHAHMHAKQGMQPAPTEENAEQQRARLAARQAAMQQAELQAAAQRADLETRQQMQRAAKLQAELEAQQRKTAELMAQLEAEKAQAVQLAAQKQAELEAELVALKQAQAQAQPVAPPPPQREPRPANRPPPPPPPSPAAAPAPRPRPATLENLALPPAGSLRPRPDSDMEDGDVMVIPGAPRLPTVGGIYSSVLDSIEELAVAPDVGNDEVRFSNAPPRKTVEIDLTDLEISERASSVSDADAEPSAQSLSKLPLFPLFAEVPKIALASLIRGAELVELADGEALMRRGDPANDLFGIVEGTVRVMARGRNMYLTLSEGDVLGEACLLQDEPRHADVLAEGDVTALRIPRDVLHEVLQHYPPLGELLLELLTRRLLGNLLQTAALFQDFDIDGKQQLARAFEIRRAAAGTVLTEVGKRMDGLYIALTGKLSVHVPGEGTRTEGAGAMFGQDALLGATPSQCDITAEVNMVVLRLPADAFSRIAMQHPMIIDKLSALSDEDVVNISL